ncbi:MAG: hypothetical protein ABSH33_13935 [Steroidobacteraceae bacterium]
MYTSFFGLSEKPFAITPDPRYLYLSERHAEALAHLLYGKRRWPICCTASTNPAASSN